MTCGPADRASRVGRGYRGSVEFRGCYRSARLRALVPGRNDLVGSQGVLDTWVGRKASPDRRDERAIGEVLIHEDLAVGIHAVSSEGCSTQRVDIAALRVLTLSLHEQ